MGGDITSVSDITARQRQVTFMTRGLAKQTLCSVKFYHLQLCSPEIKSCDATLFALKTAWQINNFRPKMKCKKQFMYS